MESGADQFNLAALENQACLDVRVAGRMARIPLDCVEKVLPLMQVTPVPGGAAFLVGMMDVRGRQLPLIDLARYLGLDEAGPFDIDASVVLCALNACSVGFVVDEVVDVTAFDAAEVDAISIDVNELISREGMLPASVSAGLGQGARV